MAAVFELCADGVDVGEVVVPRPILDGHSCTPGCFCSWEGRLRCCHRLSEIFCSWALHTCNHMANEMLCIGIVLTRIAGRGFLASQRRPTPVTLHTCDSKGLSVVGEELLP